MGAKLPALPSSLLLFHLVFVKLRFLNVWSQACSQSICCHGNGGLFRHPAFLEVNCEEEECCERLMSLRRERQLKCSLTCWAWTGHLSGGSGRSATCRHGGATPWSPRTGRCEASRWSRCTASLWCKRCRRPRPQPGGCEGSEWWCGPVYCSWTTLWAERQVRRYSSLLSFHHQDKVFLLLLTVFKVKAVKVEALDQVPQGLGLKRRHRRVAHFTAAPKESQTFTAGVFYCQSSKWRRDVRVALEVSVADGLDELLSHFNDVLFPHWDTHGSGYGL